MEIRTEVEIEAPARLVWDVLTDFASYPEWNPFIVKVVGELRKGSALAVTLSLPDSNRERVSTARLIACESERELRWLGHRVTKGLLDSEHFYRLDAQSAERTRFVHGEDLSGILLRFALNGVTELTRGCVYMNQALKRRVELRHQR